MARATDIYYKYVSPFSLAAIVMLNFLLIYMNLLNLENQSTILKEIQENTELALYNQELGLNLSSKNEQAIDSILELEQLTNETLRALNVSLSSSSSSSSSDLP